MVIVARPNSPSLPSPVTVMTFAPMVNGTDACQQGSGIGTGKKPHDPRVAEPFPPCELLQLTVWTVLPRVPFRAAVALDVENPGLGSVMEINPWTSCRSGASSSPPPQEINATTSGASTAPRNTVPSMGPS